MSSPLAGQQQQQQQPSSLEASLSPLGSLEPPVAPEAAAAEVPAPVGGVAGRALAGIVGVLLLVGGVVSTMGAALLAPLGMLVASGIARSRRRPLSRGAAWLGAVTAAVLAFAVLGGVALARTPPGTWARMRHDTDSISKVSATKPPPAWLEKIAPGAAKARQQQQMDPTAQRLIGSPAFMIWTMVMGGVFVCTIFGGFAGTVGWGATTLLLYAARGRWLPRRIASPSTETF